MVGGDDGFKAKHFLPLLFAINSHPKFGFFCRNQMGPVESSLFVICDQTEHFRFVSVVGLEHPLNFPKLIKRQTGFNDARSFAKNTGS